MNDANAAMMAEDLDRYKNALYLSLNNTLGGAFCIDGKLIQGENQKAGELAYDSGPGRKAMLLRKAGSADAYCAASALTDEKCQNMEQFMKSLENKETKAEDLWQEYLKNLAI